MRSSPDEPPRRAPAFTLARAALATATLLMPAAARAQAPAPAGLPPGLTTVSEAPPPRGPGVVMFHVESPRPLVILEHVGPQISVVCMSPCDRVVDGSRGRKFTAASDVGSTTFELSGMQGKAELEMRPPSSIRRNFGIVLTSVGGTALISSPLVLAGMGISFGGGGDAAARLAPGFTVLASGAVLLAGGIALLATARTRFDLHAALSGKAGLPSYLFGRF